MILYEDSPEDFQSHSHKQDLIITSDSDLTVAATGTQYGKSISGALWMKRQIHAFTDHSDNFLICAPTYKILQQSTLPYFLHCMRGIGDYKRADAEFKITGAGTVYFRTETDPDSIVGIPRLRAGWLDEAGKLRLYFWENYQARAAAMGARTLLTTSPYSRNWLYRQVIKPKAAGDLSDVALIQAASWENPFHSFHDIEKRRRMRGSMDPRRFDMLFGGEWGQMVGLVYDCFDETENQCDEFRLPPGTQFFGGIDWGYTEAFALVVRAITPNGDHYQVSEFYKTGLTVPAQMQIVKQTMRVFGIKRFYAGHERPENIELFCSNGIPTEGVPEKDILVGTGLHYELIQTRRYKLFKDTGPYTLDELETYHFPEPEDLGPDDDAKDQTPVGQNDHCLSANRFVTLRTYRSRFKSSPNLPSEVPASESQEQRIERLKRPSRSRGSQTENWG